MTASPSKPLSVRRAADRKLMAKRVAEIAAACGATATIQEGGDYPGPRRVIVSIKAPGGLCVNPSFDGDSWQPGVFILHWHMESRSENRLKLSFGGVNPHHFCKATHVTESFESFCDQLRLGLEMAASGEVYQQAAAAAA